MTCKVRMSATYSDTYWESEEVDSEPTVESGWTDPDNPWGGMKCEMPEFLHGEMAKEWMKYNVTYVEFNNVWDAAVYVLEFPGGVWDYAESEAKCMDYRKGVYREVTLHVDEEWAVKVFQQADRIKEARKAA